MPITNDGYEFHAKAMIGETVTPFNHDNAHIGVGNGTTAFAAEQTDLQGASKLRKAMDSGYPTRSGATLTFQSTFETGDANWAWQEWGIFNESVGGAMHNREVENLGTKTSNVTWIFQVDITLGSS
jgi:hypothetical protein